MPTSTTRKRLRHSGVFDASSGLLAYVTLLTARPREDCVRLLGLLGLFIAKPPHRERWRAGVAASAARTWARRPGRHRPRTACWPAWRHAWRACCAPWPRHAGAWPGP